MRTSASTLTLLSLLVAGCGGLVPSDQAGSRAVSALKAKDAPIEIDAKLAHAHAALLSSPEYQGRDSASAGDEMATKYAEEHFKALGFTTARQGFTHYSFKGTADNLIAVVPGKDPNRFVVIGAHKDHIGIGWTGKVHPGANDNAGGCAGVLEIGRALKARLDRGEQPEATVLLMLFSGEEKGLIGSAFYCKNPGVPQADGTFKPIAIKQIGGMVMLDVIANGLPDKFSTDTAGSDDPALKADVERTARKMGMATTYRSFVEHAPHTHGRQLPSWASSDHASFKRAGVRAVLFYAEPIHKYLHKPEDTVQERDSFKKDPNEIFNDEKMAKLTQLGLNQAMEWSKP